MVYSMAYQEKAVRKEQKKPIGYFDNIIKMSKLKSKNYANLMRLVGDYMPEFATTRLTSGGNAKEVDDNFFTMQNHKLSALVPELRLYRMDDNNNPVPFYFPISSKFNFFDDGRLDLSKPFSGNGVGIENFSVTYTGKNPFQASRKFLNASLNIKVDNISFLFDTPNTPGGPEQYAPLADLFTIRTRKGDGSIANPGSGKTQSPNRLSAAKNPKIVATLSYAMHKTDIFETKELEIIRDMGRVINLFYQAHDLKMNQDGSADISIKYNGYLASQSGNSLYELLLPMPAKARFLKASTGAAIRKKQASLRSFIASETAKNRAEAAKKAKTTTQEELEVPSVTQVMAAFREIFDSMYNAGKVHVKKVNHRDYYNSSPLEEKISPRAPAAKKSVPTVQAPRGSSAASAGIKKILRDLDENDFNPYEFLSENYIPYFTFGDLVDAYIDKIGRDVTSVGAYIKKQNPQNKDMVSQTTKKITFLLNNLKKTNILFCNAVYSRKKENKTSLKERFINIADIPVTLDTFYTEIFNSIVHLNLTYYDMNQMFTEFLPSLLKNSFGEFAGADYINSIKFTTATYTAKELEGALALIRRGAIDIKKVPKALQYISKSAVNKMADYIIICQEPSQHTRSPGNGDRVQDLKKGIYHIRANQDRGIVKSINFSKVSQPSREAYLVVRNGHLFDELRMPHNATVEMVGNNLFMPLNAVYINPDTLGFGDPRMKDSAARRLGFGGYYAVGDVTTTFSSGELSTTLNLYFNAFPEATGPAVPITTTSRNKKLGEPP
tara:strand:- start:8878 stop:11214 length:2337 start_codon:yes stop_codon:yes gene_type:complete